MRGMRDEGWREESEGDSWNGGGGPDCHWQPGLNILCPSLADVCLNCLAGAASSPMMLSEIGKAYCYILADFTTAASHNGVCITQERCHLMILFHNCSVIKDERNKKCNFLTFLSNIGFLLKGKVVRAKSFFWCSRCRIHRYVALPLEHHKKSKERVVRDQRTGDLYDSLMRSEENSENRIFYSLH